MALAEVCGLNSFVDFNATRERDYYSQDIEAYSRNFINNAQLAVPPYINVSKALGTFTSGFSRTILHLNLLNHVITLCSLYGRFTLTRDFLS